jgi:uncharacterized protein YceK
MVTSIFRTAKFEFTIQALLEGCHGLLVHADGAQTTGNTKAAVALARIDQKKLGSIRKRTLAAGKSQKTPTSLLN